MSFSFRSCFFLGQLWIGRQVRNGLPDEDATLNTGVPTLFHLVVILRTSRQEGWQLSDVARYAPRFVHGQHARNISIVSGLAAMLLAEDADPFLPRIRGLTRSAPGAAQPA